MATKTTKYGTSYETPIGLQEENYYEMMYDLMDYIKEKGLTTRQAQKLFIDCADMVLDINVNKTKENSCSSFQSDPLESIADSLSKIAYKGIDTFNPCISTN